MDKLIWSIKRAADMVRWPRSDVWEDTHPNETRLMREWAVAAAACKHKATLLELMYELAIESGVEDPKRMSTRFANFLVSEAPTHIKGEELEGRSLWFYAEGRKRIRFNN